MRLLADVLEDEYGLNLEGWVLDAALGITDDGLTIVCGGTNAPVEV
ncbi:MAG: hypothetical protein KKI02_04580 [Planctomycetes bacterium]|nr:hypothetical protein [Planctomycetota bacterium]